MGHAQYAASFSAFFHRCPAPPDLWLGYRSRKGNSPSAREMRVTMLETNTAKLPQQVTHKSQRTALGVDALAHSFLDNLFFVQGRSRERATVNDLYMALAHTVRDRLVERWIPRPCNYRAGMCAWSATSRPSSSPALTWPTTSSTWASTTKPSRPCASSASTSTSSSSRRKSPGLGNGGLGRLASCFMDSLATLDIPAIGYGIRYEYGIFDQEIRDGWQVETTDKWLRLGNPWALERPEDAFEVKIGGHTEALHRRQRPIPRALDSAKVVRGIPNDTPILGYRTNTANTMRLWSAQAVESFNFESFNTGDFFGAVADKVSSENISKILYPNDEEIQGKQLRLDQQFFFVSCSLQHILRIQATQNRPLADLHRNFTIQMNDTHPAIAVAELMRLLVDENAMEWDAAWRVTTQHPLLYQSHADARGARTVAASASSARCFRATWRSSTRSTAATSTTSAPEFPGDEDRVRRLSMIDENGERYVRMAHLAALGSHAINGVAALHTELLKTNVLQRFLRADAGKILQQDQRRHAPPLDGALQSPPRPSAHRAPRPGLDPRPREAAPPRAHDRRSRIRERMARHQAPQQAAPCRLHP